jgi:hypothetical protein
MEDFELVHEATHWKLNQVLRLMRQLDLESLNPPTAKELKYYYKKLSPITEHLRLLLGIVIKHQNKS